jgi:hypothetical protein
MKAIQVNKADKGPVLILAELEKPQPGLGEILIQVYATGVTPTELLWYTTTHTKAGTERMRAVPGHEFSAVITATGKDVQDFEIGDEVYGMNDWFAEGGHCGVLYYSALEYCAEAHNLKSRSCRLSADLSLDFMARTYRSRDARARRERINPRRRWRSWPIRCAIGAYPRRPRHHYRLSSGHRGQRGVVWPGACNGTEVRCW